MIHQVFIGLDNGRVWHLVGEYEESALAEAHADLIDMYSYADGITGFIALTVEVLA